jgi:hypothetical protein
MSLVPAEFVCVTGLQHVQEPVEHQAVIDRLARGGGATLRAMAGKND